MEDADEFFDCVSDDDNEQMETEKEETGTFYGLMAINCE